MSEINFQKKIQYEFGNVNLLKTALTHSSWQNERRNSQRSGQNNERLEFLGDAIFDAVISEALYTRLSDVEEGVLTKLRASIVCENSLAKCGQAFSIGEDIYLGKGEQNMGGRKRASITADAVEAVIAAIYLDRGWEAAKAFVLSAFEETIEEALQGKLHSDYKTDIQEILQARGETDINYILERDEGPDHSKTFYVNLVLNGETIGTGSGRTKKEAEQNAAKEAIERGGNVVL